MRSLQSDVEQRGTRIFELVNNHPERLFRKAGFYQRLMALSMHDERFKTHLFRFVAVLPSLRRSNEIIQHLGEYFIYFFFYLPPPLRVLLPFPPRPPSI